MFTRIKNKLKKFFIGDGQKELLNQNKNINGLVLINQNQILKKSMSESEVKIFSQFGEDGIIQYIIKNIKLSNNKFIEFGVENYEEANTRFLLESCGWEGLIIDSSEKNINYIKQQNYYWKFNLIVEKKFIDKENINRIFSNHNLVGDIGLLSIDIDGNDYWIWNEINNINPDIVIIEYNARFGLSKSVTVKYKKDFNRHDGNKLIYGASLKALKKLGEKKGYALIYTNSNGNNAFFVKKSLLNKNLQELTIEQAFNKNSFNELVHEKENFEFQEALKLSEISEV